ncbi:hypothetical protein H6F93_15605 [Leptolyngbya sp. FACHB-671]|uniref:hypothetical protein n=1 Tax=Leptolyngbya sp. FACHB-671 TaxID=2692812 RepID=UPI0016897393|nr:hypothetical protein [Leptolyngbya sp. FACHB-671]MBD2068930.1 hypothetical protein [Leptolyngbya sp. FACHB-671]
MMQHTGGQPRDYLNCQIATTEPIFTTAEEAIALVFRIPIARRDRLLPTLDLLHEYLIAS